VNANSSKAPWQSGGLPQAAPPAAAAPADENSARPWAAALTDRDVPQATTRARRLVEDLPDWEPGPPGELLVRRPGENG
jgi:hypothetical protein